MLTNPYCIFVKGFHFEQDGKVFLRVRNQALINNATFTLKNISLFAEIVVSFGPGKSTQKDCDDDDDDDNDDDDDDDDDDDEDDSFFMKYIFGKGVLSLFFCGFF